MRNCFRKRRTTRFETFASSRKLEIATVLEREGLFQAREPTKSPVSEVR